MNPAHPESAHIGPASRLWWAPLLWFLAGAVYLACVYEAITPDSYAYVAAAESVLESGCICLPFAPAASASVPVPMSAWPPGYPLLVTLVAASGLDVWLAARLAAGVSLVLAVFIGALWLRRRDGGMLALACVLFCSLTAVVAATSWSEGPFLLALVLTFTGVLAWQRTDRRPPIRALPLVCAGLAAALLLRHAGWFIVPVVCVLMLRRAAGRRILVLTTVFAALLPSAVWLARSRGQGEWAHPSFEVESLWRATGETLAALGKMALVPWLTSVPLQAATGVLLAGGICLAAWSHRGRVRTVESDLAMLFGGSLLAGTWLARCAQPGLFLISDRLVWPAWMFLAVGIALRLGSSRSCGRAATLAMGLLILSQTAGIVTLPSREPRRVDSKQRLHDTTQPSPDQTVVSNEAWRAWHLFGSRGFYLPRSDKRQSLLLPDSLLAWAQPRGVTYLVWFDDGLSESQSVIRYGPLAMAGYGHAPGQLELVALDDTHRTYRIRLNPENPDP